MFGVTDFTAPIINYSSFDPSQLVTALGFGGAILLIGMVTIFAVLALLWLCLIIFKFAFHDLPEKKAKKAAAEVQTEEVVTESASQSSEDEIIAVIAAAIAMAESESSGVKFNVVSFKKR